MNILGRRRNDALAEADFREPPTKQIAQKENLHSYIVFVTQVSLRKHGSHCNGSLLVAFATFSLNIVLQLALTLITGGHIMEESSEFFTSLVTGSAVVESEQLWEDYHKVLDPLEWWAGAQDIAEQRTISRNESSCCKGPACAHEGQCCAPARRVSDSDVSAKEADADFLTDAALLEAHRPRGRSGRGQRGRGGSAAVGKEKAVCTLQDEELDCSPPSSAYADYWSELDEDGDGRWTHEEATADAQNLGCHLGVAAEEVFRHACRSIVADTEDSAGILVEGRKRLGVQLPPELVERRAISLDYFNWWVGLVAICVHIDAAKCGELVQEGLFEGAMSPELKGSRGGVVDLDSAIEYCERILKPGGLCDMVLPGTFLMFRDRTQEKCGDQVEVLGPRITNPFRETDSRYINEVSYQNLKEYSTTHTKTFRFFLFLVLVTWYVRLLDEFKECFEFFDFVWNFSSSSQGTLDESHDGKTRLGNLESGEPEASESAWATSQVQRSLIAGTTLVRFWLVVYLANVGTVYHLSTRSYVDLLLNAIALAFVFELSEFIYMFLVPDDAKSEVGDMDPFSFTTSMPQGDIARRIASKPFFGLLVIPAIATFAVAYNDVYRTQPVLEALQCTCLLRGERCIGAGRFPKTWWDNHWGEVSGLHPVPGQSLLELVPVVLDQDDIPSSTQANATAFPDFLLQTNETQSAVAPADAQPRQGVTLRAVEQHVANAAGFFQVAHVRDQAPTPAHDVAEL